MGKENKYTKKIAIGAKALARSLEKVKSFEEASPLDAARNPGLAIQFASVDPVVVQEMDARLNGYVMRAFEILHDVMEQSDDDDTRIAAAKALITNGGNYMQKKIDTLAEKKKPSNTYNIVFDEGDNIHVGTASPVEAEYNVMDDDNE